MMCIFLIKLKAVCNVFIEVFGNMLIQIIIVLLLLFVFCQQKSPFCLTVVIVFS